jgi:prepilin-type N-terminal cleavage/methylation domain-containing protein
VATILTLQLSGQIAQLTNFQKQPHVQTRSNGNEKRGQAFTLIELLIVIVIIGILVGIGIPLFTNARGNAQAGKIKQALDAVALAKAQWAVDPTNSASGISPGTVPTTNQIFPYITVQGVPLTNWSQLLSGTTNSSISINALNTAPTSP